MLKPGPVYHIYVDEHYPLGAVETAELVCIKKRTHFFRFANGYEYKKGDSDQWHSSIAGAWRKAAFDWQYDLWRLVDPFPTKVKKRTVSRSEIRRCFAELENAWAQHDAARDYAALSYSI
jgi:hypothetical protein